MKMARTISERMKENVKEIKRLNGLGLPRRKIRDALGMEELYFNNVCSRYNIKISGVNRVNNVSHLYFNKGISA